MLKPVDPRCVEDCSTIDLADLHLLPCFRGWEPFSATVRWQVGLEAGKYTLQGLPKVADDAWLLELSGELHQGVTEKHTLSVFAVQNRAGISRWWFVCPQCGRPVRTLHSPSSGDEPRCRRCYGLTYRSVQRESKAVNRRIKARFGWPQDARLPRKRWELLFRGPIPPEWR